MEEETGGVVGVGNYNYGEVVVEKRVRQEKPKQSKLVGKGCKHIPPDTTTQNEKHKKLFFNQ